MSETRGELTKEKGHHSVLSVVVGINPSQPSYFDECPKIDYAQWCMGYGEDTLKGRLLPKMQHRAYRFLEFTPHSSTGSAKK